MVFDQNRSCGSREDTTAAPVGGRGELVVDLSAAHCIPSGDNAVEDASVQHGEPGQR